MTSLNRKVYANRVAHYYLVKSVKPELSAFLRGFYQVIPHHIISVLDADELEFLMGGCPDIDLDDW